MRSRFVAPLAVLLMVLCAFSVVQSDESSADTEVYGGDLLLDRGNGDTLWLALEGSGTYGDAITASLTAAGIENSVSGGKLKVEGKESDTIGAAGSGSFTVPGTTGHSTVSSWHIFVWDSASEEWSPVSDLSAACPVSTPVAVAFYPDGVIPVETPDHRSSWTMFGADAENSANQICELPAGEGGFAWSKSRTDIATGCYTSALYARGHVFAKFGSSVAGSDRAFVASYDAVTGTEEWKFDYPCHMIETTGFLIAGQYIYIQSSEGHIYKFPWKDGPGTDNSNVTIYGGAPYGDPAVIPNSTGAELVTVPNYGEGPYTMVFDSGSIFLKHYNGMVYCFDMDLNLQWSYQTGGGCYVTAPTVTDDYVAAGSYDGYLYILDKHTGSLVAKQFVYQRIDHVKTGGVTVDKVCGSVNTPVFVRTSVGYTIFTSYSDGLIMDSTYSGIAVFDFDGTTLTPVKDFGNSLGTASSYMTRFVKDDFKGVIVATSDGIHKIDVVGRASLVTDVVAGAFSSHAAPTLVNNSVLYSTSYGKSQMFTYTTDGKMLGQTVSPVKQYCMAPVAVAGGYALFVNDAGISVFDGALSAYVTPSSDDPGMPLWELILIVLALIIVIIAAIWAMLRFGKRWEKPFAELSKRAHTYFYGENYSHNTKSRRKLAAVTVMGIVLTFAVCILSLCIGSGTTVGPGEALSALFSAISKGGDGLTSLEYLVYVNRAPRAMAALGAGIGLSVAGAMYQAVIKNPLVEPYIMGVSAGSGTLVVAVITMDFTLFGLLTTDNPYLIALSAIVGGLLAFGCTMFLASKTGGKSVNYVLAGIVVGLVFSAVQSLLIVMAGNKISSALSWLYGSFTGITWEEAWFVLIPCLLLSLIPLLWSKELNLVLLGEDQARQLGLDAVRFDRCTLILASIITAFCVAFCGIIGFVGLVIPHLSRMLVGGDHRMMLPVSMALGGFLMVLADLLARVAVPGYELPVGAVTAFIGVPVFAYLLIKRGRGYDA